MALNLGPLNVLLRLQGADKFKKDAKGSAASLDLIGKASVAATAAIAAAGYQAVKATQVFAEFERGMTRVGAVTNSLGTTAFAGLTERAEELASKTEFTARQVADAMGFMGMSGMSTNQIFEATPAVLQLASAGMVDVASAADTVTNIMSGYGLEAKDLVETNNILVATFTNSNTSLQSLGETFKYAGPIAKSAGLSLKQTAAIIGLMGNSGIQASMAGTALRSTLNRLQGDSKAVVEVLDKYNIKVKDSSGKMKDFGEIFKQLARSVKDPSDRVKLFGQEAVGAMVPVLDKGSEALDKMIGKIEGAGNVAERISAAQLQTLDGRIKIMQSNFEGLQIAIGKALGPAAVKIVDNMSIVFGDLKDAINGVGVGLLDSEAWAEAFEGIKNFALAIAATIDTIAQGVIKIVMFPITLITRAIAEAEWFVGTMMKAFKNIPGMRGVYEAGVGMREQGIARRENLQQLMTDIGATKPIEDSLRSFFTMFESSAKELAKAVGGDGAGAGAGGAGGGGDTGTVFQAPDKDALRAAYLREIAPTDFDAAASGIVDVLAKAGYAPAMSKQMGFTAPGAAGFGGPMTVLSKTTTDLAKKQAEAAEKAAALGHRAELTSAAFKRAALNVIDMVSTFASAFAGGTMGATLGPQIASTLGSALGAMAGSPQVGAAIGGAIGQIFGPLFDVIANAVEVFKPLIAIFNEMGVAILLPMIVAMAPGIESLARVLKLTIPMFEAFGMGLGALDFVMSNFRIAIENLVTAIQNVMAGNIEGAFTDGMRDFVSVESYLARIEEERAAILAELNGETNATTERFRELNEELSNVPIGVKRLRGLQFNATRGAGVVPFPGMFNQPAF